MTIPAPIPARHVGLAAPPFRGVIEAAKIIEYAEAIHIRNPIHFDRKAARAAGFRDIVAPPGLINPFLLQPRSAKFETFRIDEFNAIAGEWSWEHLGIVCAGDELHGQSVLVEISRKQGHRPMTALGIETKFFNQDDRPVVIVMDVTLAFEGQP